MTTQISPGQKFSFVALSTNRDVDFPTSVSLGSGAWVTTVLPVGLDDKWRKWIGTIRTESIEEDCNLFLCAAMESAKPGVLDEENQRLSGIVTRLFDAMPMTGNIQFVGKPILVSGARERGGLSIRQIGELTAPGIPGGVGYEEFTAAMLKEAYAMMEVRHRLERAATWDRLSRIFYIWSKALREPNSHERLHQFCRCIEGLILPDKGDTTKQFVSRTELYVGPRHHETMRRIYDMRSRTEHMHPYEFPEDLSERDRRLELMRMVALAQGLASQILRHFLLTPNMWAHYADAATLAAFWRLEPAHRRAIWGQPLDLAGLDKAFDASEYTDERLGL